LFIGFWFGLLFDGFVFMFFDFAIWKLRNWNIELDWGWGRRSSLQEI